MANRKPRNKWNSLKMANRIPEVDLERKLTDIRRYHAHIKRDARIEETKIWDELFENDRILQTSIAKFPKKDVVDRLTLVLKTPEEEEPQRFSDYYRQFIIFKANAMGRIFGGKVQRRPRYSELYAKETAPERNNRHSIEVMFRKYYDELVREERKRSLLAPIIQADDPEGTQLETNGITLDDHARRPSLKVQQASPQHRRNSRAPRQSVTLETNTIGSKSLVLEPAFRLPAISDRFKSKKDRMINREIDRFENTTPDFKRESLASLPEIERACSDTNHGDESPNTSEQSFEV